MTKIIISFILIGISIFVVFRYVKPTYNEAESVIDNTVKYTKALKKANEIQALRQSLLSQYNLFTNTNRDKLKKLLPNDVDNVRLVLDIDGIASARNIRISSVKVQKNQDKSTDIQTGTAIGFNSAATAAEQYHTLVLEFVAIASYEQFKLFMQDLEHSLRIVDLINLNVTQANQQRQSENKNNNDSEPDLYKFNVGIRTYWLK